MIKFKEFLEESERKVRFGDGGMLLNPSSSKNKTKKKADKSHLARSSALDSFRRRQAAHQFSSDIGGYSGNYRN